MSFKHLFEKAQTLKSLSNQSADEVGSAIESAEYQRQDIIKERRFIPAVDYTTASNFARYGSAEKYYGESIDRIYKTYPYDGSLRERLKWENESTEIDLYILNNLYPRRTGYGLMSPSGWGTRNGSLANGYGLPNTLEYIYFKGGPHPNPDGMSPLSLQFTGSNFYDTGSNRTSNLKYDLSGDGVTVEFWMKKDAYASSLTTKEVIFDMWNGATEGLAHYGRLSLALNSSNEGAAVFTATLLSGSDGVSESSIGSAVTIADSTWHHYAFSFKNATAGITSRVYIDGALNQESTLGSDALNEVTGAMQATLGALATTLGGAAQYAGKLSASLDEFRYWKTQRSSQDVGRFWFTQVGGGVNTDPQTFKDTTEVANTTLGVYYKFNEGITGTSSVDSNVLDYSGRISNGAWTGYTSDSRNTGSAIISSSAAIKEFEDPIIYSFDPAVVTLRAGLIQSGSDHDASNAASIYKSIPAWITEEDVERGSQLHNVTQIMASYLDTLHLQIESLNKLKDINYVSGSDKVSVFSERLLMSTGLVSPELFVDATVLEKLGDRSEDRVFEKNITEIKNQIYQNIYNNLSYIYKTKGTEKSFRNLIRCFGIDDELIKINMYANNAEFDFTTNRKNQSYGKKYVNFNSIRSMDANVFQFRDPGDTTNTYGFISSSTNLTGGFAFTMEADVLFPEKFDQSHDFYQDTNIISCSLFGVHATTAQSSDTAGSENAQTDTAFPTDDATNFQVYAVRETKDSPNVTFILKSSTGGKVPTLTSSMYYDVYDNNQWNFAVKISPSRYPWTAYVPTAPIADYDIEFQGVNVDAGVVVNSFNVTGTATAPGAAFMTGSRRAFVGAHRTNMTGTVLQRCDAKIGSCRLWLDKLSQETIKAHALDPTNYGLADTGLYAFPFQATASYGDLPRINTLMLNWDFNQNTGSDAAGSFRVADLSSGSATMASTRNDWLGNILYYQHPGSGSSFSASATSVVDKEYVVASKQNLPESLESSDMITVLSQQDEVEFTRDSRPLNYFLAFEKSMQQSISDQMINYFATLTDLNTIIGAPVNRYRGEYKGLKLLRQRFFEGVSNSEIDFEKFFEYYKWIDGALSVLLGQLAPISLDFDPNIRTLIESHILERSKYQNKFPFLAQSDPDLTGSIGTIATPITVNSIINDAQGTGIESAQAPTKRVTGMPNTSVLNSWKYDHAPLGSTTPTPLSLLFDGVDEYVSVGAAATWEPLIGGANGSAKEYSVSFWFKPAAMVATNTWLYSFGTRDRDLFLLGGSLGAANLKATNKSNSGNYAQTAAGELTADTWHHITVTCAGGSAGLTTIYIDGADATDSQDVSAGGPDEIIGNSSIGADPAAGSYTKGNFCDFAVWDKELSSAEVTEIYGAGARVKLSTSTCQSNLLSWWKLGNGLDDTYTGAGALADEAGGRDGTPTNFDSASDIEADSPDFIANYNGAAQNSKSVWWQNRAGRDLPAFATPDNVDADREVLLNAIKSSNNRTLGRPYRFSGGGSVVLGGVARHPSQRKGVVYEATAPAGPTVGQGTYGAVPSDIMVAKSADVESLISSSDEYFPSQKVRYGFGMGVQSASYKTYERDTDGATVAPFSLYSSSISDALSSEMSNFTGSTIITNMHADLTSDQTDVPMQGPFTEKFVGGRQHRHIELNQSGSPDSISDDLTMANNFNGLDTRVNRPEGFRVQMGYEFTGSNTGSPWKASSGHLQVVSPQYPELDTSPGTTNLYDRPKANLPRGEYAKRPVNIKNIRMTTASLSQSMSGVIDHNRIGNYTKNYEVIQTAGRSQNDPYFREGTFTFAPNPETMATRGRFPMLSGAVPSASSPYATASNRGPNVSGALDYELPVRTGSASNQTILVNRFNAPGSPEASSQGYLDPAHEEFSVYNALPYRNQTVVNYGLSGSASLAPSGSNSIIPQDQLDLPRGLNQLSTLHCGPFGADSAFGEITLAAAIAGADGTVVSPSFHKTQRNSTKRLKYIQETRSLLFDGVDDQYLCNGGISTVDSSWENLIGGAGSSALPFTFSFWVNLDSVAQDQTIISLGTDARGVYFENTGDYMQFFIGKDSGGNDGIVRTGALTAGRWYHIVATFSGGDPGGSDTEDDMKIYLNGALDTTVVSELDDPKEIPGDGDGFRIGGREWGYLDGYLSNVAIWKAELSAAEVSAIYNSGHLFDLARVKIDDLLAWYRMSDQGGLEPPDSTVLLQNRAPKAAYYFGTAGRTNFRARAGAPGAYASTVPASPPTWPIVTGSVYDNLYEQHGVPNADRNYAWITASLEADVPFYGFDQKIPAPGQTDTPWYIGNKSTNWNSSNYGLEDADEYARDKWNALIGGPVGAAKAYSYSMWVRPTTMVDSIPKFVSWGGFARYLEIYGASLPAPLRAYNGPVMGGNYRASSTSLSANTWYHVVVTYEGVYEGNPPNIYINGALDNGAGAATSDPAGFGVYGMSVGASEVNTMDYRGHMCDLAVWTKALSAGEAFTIYNNGVRFNLKASNAPERLVAWWPLGSDPEDVSSGYDDVPPAFYDEVSRQKLVALIGPGVAGPPIDSSEAPSAKLPLYGFYKNTTPKVPEISAYVERGLQSTSGTTVPDLYPFQGRPSGTYGAPTSTTTSMNQLYEPPYSSLIDSASVNIAGFAYGDHSIRYANLDTHVLEAPAFAPNTSSLWLTGTWGVSGSSPYEHGGFFVAGAPKDWNSYGAPLAYSQSSPYPGHPASNWSDAHASLASPWTMALWLKIVYTGSYIEARQTASNPAVDGTGTPWMPPYVLSPDDKWGGDAGAMQVAGWKTKAIGNWFQDATSLVGTGLSLYPALNRDDDYTNSSSANPPKWIPVFAMQGTGTSPTTDANNNTRYNGFVMLTGSDWNLTSGSGGYLESDKWYHIVLTYDGISPKCASEGDSKLQCDSMKMYVNGVDTTNNGLVASGTVFGTTQTAGNAGGLENVKPIGGAFAFGGVSDFLYSWPFRGYLNDIQLYNTVLSASEVTELYQRRSYNLFNYPFKHTMTNWWRMGSTQNDDASVIYDVVGGIQANNMGLTGTTAINPQTALSATAPATGSSLPGSNEFRFISGTQLANSFVTFNHAMLNNNGPYQSPTWKQVRTGDTPMARALRKANRISIASPPPMVPTFVPGGTNAINFVRGKSSTEFVDYVESPVQSKYKTFVAAFEDRSENPDRGNNSIVEVSYGNNLGYFSNNGLNNKLNLRLDVRANQPYTEVQDYIDKTGDQKIEVYASYGERVYPADVNSYQSRVRTRQNYSIKNVWNDIRRMRSFDGLNSQGWPAYSFAQQSGTQSPGPSQGDYLADILGRHKEEQVWPGDVQAQSSWPLDAPGKYTELTNSSGFESGTGSILAADGTTRVYNTASVFKKGQSGFYGAYSDTNMLGDAGVFSLFNNLIQPGSGAGAGELQNTYNYFSNINAVRRSDLLGILNAQSQSSHPAACYLRPLTETPARIQAAGPAATTTALIPAGTTLMGFHPWVAPHQTGLSPYKPYQEYAENLRIAGKDCSIVPEYRISEHLETYLGNENTEPADNSFLTKLGNLLGLTGSSLDSTTKDFYSVYATTDFLELFRVVDADLRGPRGQSESDNIVRHGTTLQATAFTSFLPYKGFYPAERTVKLASYFSQSMGSFLPGTRSNDLSPGFLGAISSPAATPNQTLSRILLEPLFAPGILFNTIKSGIAVGNYVLRNTASNPGDTEGNTPWNMKAIGPVGLSAKVPGSWETTIAIKSASAGDPYMHTTIVDDYYEYNFNSSASYQSASVSSASFGALNIGHSGNAALPSYNPIIQSYGEGADPVDIVEQTRWGYYLYKVPFEAIRQPARYLSYRALAGVTGASEPPLWDGGRLSNTASAGSNSPVPERGVGAGWLYDTGIQESSSIANQVVTSLASTGTGSIFDGLTSGPLNDQRQNKIRWDGAMSTQLYELAIDNFLCETVNFFQDGLTSYVSKEETAWEPVTKNNYYGMRVSLYRSTTDDGNPNFGMYSRASAFGTPVCVTGSHGLGITYSHLTPSYYNGTSHVDIVWQAPYSDRPTMQDIASRASVFYSRRIEDNVEVSPYNFSSSYVGYVTSSQREDYDYNQMQITASVNIFDKVLAIPEGTNEQKVQWLVQTKFETPIFDFYDTPSLPHPTASTSASYLGDGATPSAWDAPIDVTSSAAPFQIRGMWHQYGRIPEPSKGVFLGISDLPIEYHMSGTGEIQVSSLREVVGFGNAGDKRVGELSTSKTVREAVLVVPFRTALGEREFIKLPSTNIFERSSELAERARSRGREQRGEFWDEMLGRYNRQVELLERYILPPTLDFFINRSVRPIFFDAFEFTETFSSKDLQNMWQNLPPESNQKMRRQSSTINISDFFTDRIFGRTDIQWLVFKVKQRATKDYDILSKRGLTRDIPLVPSSIKSPYSFNWPYDYFSLVELLKIDENVEYVSKGAGATPWEDPPPPPRLGASPGSDTTGQSQFVGNYTEAEATAILNDLNNNQND